MKLQEMEAAVRLNLPVVAMFWEDGESGLIAWKQRGHFGTNTDLAFGNPERVKLAESFGWEAERVERSKGLAGALERNLDSERSSLIVIPIDDSENDKLSARRGQIACRV